MTDKEYGALEEAIDEIKYLKSLVVLSKGPVWALQWFALEFEMTNEEPRYATMPVSSDEKLVTEARKSLEAFEFAKWIAAGRSLPYDRGPEPSRRSGTAYWMLATASIKTPTIRKPSEAAR